MRSAGSGLDSLQGFKLGLLNGLLVLTAMFFVHREVWRHLDLWPLLFSNWSENVLAAVAVLQGYLTGAFSRAQIDSGLQTSYRWAMRWGTPAFLFLYVAAAALCERLHFGDWNSPICRAAGVAIIVISLVLRIWTHATIPAALRSGTKSGEATFDKVRGPFKWIRHPDRAGRILFLVGTPLCFTAWVPLFALPGAVVLLNWHLNDLEAFCLSQLGEPYLLYKERTKRLIPRVF